MVVHLKIHLTLFSLLKLLLQILQYVQFSIITATELTDSAESHTLKVYATNDCITSYRLPNHSPPVIQCHQLLLRLPFPHHKRRNSWLSGTWRLNSFSSPSYLLCSLQEATHCFPLPSHCSQLSSEWSPMGWQPDIRHHHNKASTTSWIHFHPRHWHCSPHWQYYIRMYASQLTFWSALSSNEL